MMADRPPVSRADRTADNDWLANAGALTIGRFIVAGLGWTATVIIARSLDQETFGRFTFVFGLLAMLTIVTDLGLGRVALAGVLPGVAARDRSAGSYLVLRMLLGVVGYVLAVGFVVVARYPTEIVQAVAIAGIVVIIATASHGYELILQAELRMQAVAVAAVAGRLAQLGVTVAVVMAGGRLLWLLVPAIVAEIVIFIVKVPRALRLLRPRYGIHLDHWRSMVRDALPLSIGAALATVAFRADAIMLSKLADFDAVAVYGVAFKFVDIVHFIALSASAPLLTALVGAWPDHRARFIATVRRSSGLVGAAAGLLVVHFGLFAAETIGLLYLPRYEAGADALRLLVAGEILSMGSVLGLTVLTATGHHRHYPTLALAGLVLNIGTNLVAIPRWGYEGAAVTTVATEALVVAGMWWLLRRRLIPAAPGLGSALGAPLGRALPPIGAGLAVGWLAASIGPWPVAAVAATAAWLAAAAASGLLAIVTGRR